MFNAGRPGGSQRAGPNTRCQKCLKYGHFTYECKNARPYVPRPSRTAQLAEGGGSKERRSVEVPDDLMTSGKGVADRILKAKEEARKRLEAEEAKEKRKAAKAEKGKKAEKSRARSYVIITGGADGRPTSSESDSDSMSDSSSDVSDRPRTKRYSSSPEPKRREERTRRRYTSEESSPPRRRRPDSRSPSPRRRRYSASPKQ